jgi:hypothetical protein
LAIRYGYSISKDKDGKPVVKVKQTTRKHTLAEKLAMKLTEDKYPKRKKK